MKKAYFLFLLILLNICYSATVSHQANQIKQGQFNGNYSFMNGNIGIGTSNPGAKLDVAGNARIGTSIPILTLGDLSQNSASMIKLLGSNTQTNWQISTVTVAGHALEFIPSTVAGGSTFTTPLMVLKGDTGNVGIGTNSPQTKLDVNGDINVPGGSTYGLTFGSSSNGKILSTTAGFLNIRTGSTSLNFDNSAGSAGLLSITNGGNVCGVDAAFEPCSSDIRLKKNIINSTYKLKDVLKLKAIRFDWNDMAKEKYHYENIENQRIGFIAQDIEQIFPNWVTIDSNGYKKVDDGELRYALLQTIQEQQIQIEKLQTELCTTNNNSYSWCKK